MRRFPMAAFLALAAVFSAAAQKDPRVMVERALSADYDKAAGQKLVEEAAAYGQGTKELVNGIVLSFLAFYDGEEYLKGAVAATEKLQDTGVGMATFAACRATMGKYALLTYKKTSDPSLAAVASAAVVDANALLVKAVAKDGRDISTRYLRLLVNVEIARLSPFDLGKDSADDCAFLLSELPKQADLDPAFRAQCLYYVAEYYALTKKINKACGYYDKARREAPGSRCAKNALQRLNELEG
jgi:hypothetical protein